MNGSGVPARGRAGIKAAALLLAVLVTSSCAALGPDVDGATDTAASFERAVAHRDAATACAMLAPQTRSELESGGSPCQQALLQENLPRAGSPQGANAYGGSAQVVLGGDVVFLGRFGHRWLVTAAGCRPRDARPYDCTVSGG
jgi:hypothetical protein